MENHEDGAIWSIGKDGNPYYPQCRSTSGKPVYVTMRATKEDYEKQLATLGPLGIIAEHTRLEVDSVLVTWRIPHGVAFRPERWSQ